MAKIVICSDKFATDWDFAAADDFICKMMESVVLAPHNSVDIAIADYWSPQAAIDELWTDECYEEDEGDSWYEYQYHLYNEAIPELEVYNLPLVWEYDLADFVAANDGAGLCEFLRRKGILVVRSA
jgi:hypothetical protein